MAEPRHSAEGYRVVCIFLAVILAVVVIIYYRDVEGRNKAILEYRDRVEELEQDKKDLQRQVEDLQNTLSLFEEEGLHQ